LNPTAVLAKKSSSSFLKWGFTTGLLSAMEGDFLAQICSCRATIKALIKPALTFLNSDRKL